MGRKIKKRFSLLLIAFFILPIFIYSFLSSKEIPYQNEFQISYTCPSLSLDSVLEPSDDEFKLEYFSSLYLILTPAVVSFSFLFLFVFPFYPVCLSFHQLSIPPPLYI